MGQTYTEVKMEQDKKDNENTSITKDLVDLGLIIAGGIGGGALAHGISKMAVKSKNPLVNAGLLIIKTGAVFDGARTGHKLCEMLFDNDIKEKFKNIYKPLNYTDTKSEESVDEEPNEYGDEDEDELF